MYESVAVDPVNKVKEGSLASRGRNSASATQFRVAQLRPPRRAADATTHAASRPLRYCATDDHTTTKQQQPAAAAASSSSARPQRPRVGVVGVVGVPWLPAPPHAAQSIFESF